MARENPCIKEALLYEQFELESEFENEKKKVRCRTCERFCKSCNFSCPWCQNWDISKSVPNPARCNYVYIGNVPGHPYENTYCPRCGALLIKRYGFDVVSYRITTENKCPECGQAIHIIT